ncbi:MAG: chromate resistance protein ChrB domain-containing protein [Pseudomonadota bacterium]
MPAPTEIAPAQLFRLIGGPDAPSIVDVRTDEDFEADPRLLPTARRAPYGSILDAAPRLAGRKTVVVCHRGLKLSHGAAALLRSEGIAAEALAGGAVAWAEAGLPMVSAAAIPPRGGDGATLWVTRQRPKIDRVACPWLIRRFVDPGARFLFVPPAEVAPVADRFGAEPFDSPGARFSDSEGGCSFDAMLDAFGLRSPPLDDMAAVIRAADAGRPEDAPQAAGLLAVLLGLSRLHRDDLAQVEAATTVFDALYRWARDAQSETHDDGPEATR